MPVIQQGSTNINNLKVPNVYTQIQKPQATAVNGVPTNTLGMVGTASWGLVNSPVVVGSLSEFQTSFGEVLTDPHDLGTAVSIAALQGANNMLCVRVTDGTDTKATANLLSVPPLPPTVITIAAQLVAAIASDPVVGAVDNLDGTYKVSSKTPADSFSITVDSLQDYKIGSAVLSVDTVADNTNYFTKIDTTNYIYNSGVGATAISIAAGLVAAAALDPTVDFTDNLDGTYNVTSKIPTTHWDLSVDSNQSFVVKEALVTVDTASTSETYSTGINSNTYNYTWSGSASVGLILTALYSGEVGNTITATVGEGSNSSQTSTSYKISILRPGYPPEVFDNISGSGEELYMNIMDAINKGQSSVRSKSLLVVASLPVVPISVSPALNEYTLTGGTNGNTTITGNTLLGIDGTTRTGLYSLRGSQASIAFLVGNTDDTTWANEAAYGLSEGTYMILTGAAGEYADISGAATNKKTVGLDCYDVKLLLGDWCYFNDTVNGQLRLVSPQAYVAGKLANTSPEQSSLNNQIYGIVGTQSTENAHVYSDADLILLINAGIDVVTIQSPGGNYFSCRIGCNTSSNPLTNGDNYTRLTNYIAYSLDSAAGVFIGKTITPTLMSAADGTITNFLYNMQKKEMIDNFSVQLNDANNPPSQTVLGMMQADVKVQYFAILAVFLINVEGSQATTVVQSVQPV